MKRTLKEQEYQLIALKNRSEKMFYGFLLELIVGIVITYLLLQWHWMPAGLFGAWSIISVGSVFSKWQRYAREYVSFKVEFEAMVFHGRTMAFVNKITASVKEGEKELARMEQEMRDDTTE